MAMQVNSFIYYISILCGTGAPPVCQDRCRIRITQLQNKLQHIPFHITPIFTNKSAVRFHLIEKQLHHGNGLIFCIAGLVFKRFDQVEFIHGEFPMGNDDLRL